ncbi:unnamed protein product [Haemonchus placei]|uniref:Cyclophil_like domain-containing protein n=1 Tax=Haemonchus placei TaxID=6290 RepID=A0A0N4W3M3_HAEPC|nr:unnamed protein product [Haemonchus placei]
MDKNVKLTSLRFEVFVNIPEYLPLMEAAGNRLTVRTIEEQPFPDLLGHSAPTGFVSSFGIKLKTTTRLPAPCGDCIHGGKDEDYIYVTKQRVPEARNAIRRTISGDNCFQVSATVQVFIDFFTRKSIRCPIQLLVSQPFPVAV